MKKERPVILFTLVTYVLFLAMLFLTAGIMYGLKNDILTAVAKNLCSWAPTLSLLILFPRLIPQMKRKEFFANLFKNKISWSELIVVVLVQIIIFVASVLLYSRVAKIELSSLVSCSFTTIVFAIINSLTSGATGEEAGWRGYLQPIMTRKFGLTKGCIVVGIIWAFWHAPLWFLSGEYHGLILVKYIILFVIFVISTSVIIGVNYNERGNILVPVTIHFFVNFLMAFVKSNLIGVLQFISLFYAITAVVYVVVHKNRLKRTQPL